MQRFKRQKLVNSRNSPREFWKNVKECSNVNDVTDKIKPFDWHQHFKQLLTPPIEEQHNRAEPLQQLRQDFDDSDLNKIITDQEVRKSILSLRSNKAPGPDELCIEFFKHTIDYILTFLTALFNDIFTSGIIPESWGLSIICLILEKKDFLLTQIIFEVCH